MSEEDDVTVDVPSPPDTSAFPPEWKAKNELNRQGTGITPQNARRMIAGGDKKEASAESEPTAEDLAAVAKLLEGKDTNGTLSALWKQFLDWRQNRPAMQGQARTGLANRLGDLNNYYWETKERNSRNAPGARGDPAKKPVYTEEQTEAYLKDQARIERMRQDVRKRNIDRGFWKLQDLPPEP